MAKRTAEVRPTPTAPTANDDDGPRKKQKPNEKDLIKDLNTLSIPDLQSLYFDQAWLHYTPQPRTTTPSSRSISDPGRNQASYTLTLKSAPELSTTELNNCYDLISSTSKPDYETSTFGWHPRRKLREMRDKSMRYLLVRPSSTSTVPDPSTNHPPDSKPKSSTPAHENPVMAFLSFMPTHDSDPPVPVLYIYEIHLSPPLRKQGLGAHLMQIVETLAENTGVRKVMLTCFLANEKALSFYKRRGYAADVSSPGPRKTRGRIVEPDYVIMSRAVPPKAEERAGNREAS